MFKKIISIFILSTISISFIIGQDKIEITKDYTKSGSFARLKSMGENPFITDPTDLMTNPALGNKFSNMLYGDLGTTIASNFGSGGVGQYFTANFSLSNNFTLGATLARKDFSGVLSISNLDPFGLVRESNSLLQGVGLVEMDNNWALISSYKLGNHTLGFGISYASTTAESRPANGGANEGFASQLGLNVGYFGKINSRISLELSGVLLYPHATYKTPQSSQTKFNQSIVSLSGRAYYKTNSKFTIVPYGKGFKASGTADLGDENGVTSTDLPSYLSITFGIGVMYKLGNFLFAGGPSFGYLQEKTPAVAGVAPVLTKNTTSFPMWNVGAEWQILNWLVGRIGYKSRTSTVSTETVASLTNTNETIVTSFEPVNGGLTLGVGFRFSGLFIDATVNEDILRQGLNNLGGGGATFAYVSAGYLF